MSTHVPQSNPNRDPESSVPADARMVAGLWRRFFAFAIDGVFLGMMGLLAGVFFFDQLADLGPVSRLAGFLFALLYFGILESSIGHGQSIGKQILGLRVVDLEGRSLSAEESLLRYMVFAVPWFLSGMPLPVSRTPGIVLVLLGTVGIGTVGINLYLILSSRGDRRGLHDLAAQSYVARKGNEGQLAPTPVRKAQWVIAGALFMVLGPICGALSSRILEWGPFPQLTHDARLAEQIEGVQHANAHVVYGLDMRDAKPQKTLAIEVCRKDKISDDVVFENEVAKRVLENDPRAWKFDRITITTSRKFDLGFFNSTRSRHASHTPAEWRDVLYGGAPEEANEAGQEDK